MGAPRKALGMKRPAPLKPTKPENKTPSAAPVPAILPNPSAPVHILRQYAAKALPHVDAALKALQDLEHIERQMHNDARLMRPTFEGPEYRVLLNAGIGLVEYRERAQRALLQ